MDDSLEGVVGGVEGGVVAGGVVGGVDIGVAELLVLGDDLPAGGGGVEDGGEGGEVEASASVSLSASTHTVRP